LPLDADEDVEDSELDSIDPEMDTEESENEQPDRIMAARIQVVGRVT
jgi:hypothetical protein